MDKKELLRLSNLLWDKSRNNYSKLYENEDSYKDIMDYRQLHSKVVADLAVNMFDTYYKHFYGKAEAYYKSSLYFACLIHDVRKIDKKHNFKGANFFFKHKNLVSSNLYDIELVFNIVNFHSADKKGTDLEYINKIMNLNDNVKLLILFTRLSDKLSKLVVKSKYKRISTEDVDDVLNKINNNSKELFNSSTKQLIKDIEIEFKGKFCS